jgi:hypothetical protein
MVTLYPELPYPDQFPSASDEWAWTLKEFWDKVIRSDWPDPEDYLVQPVVIIVASGGDWEDGDFIAYNTPEGDWRTRFPLYPIDDRGRKSNRGKWGNAYKHMHIKEVL